MNNNSDQDKKISQLNTIENNYHIG
ncbi:MAG: hypothetical protein RJB21_266, partial [Pseudomonadota bacterium]